MYKKKCWEFELTACFNLYWKHMKDYGFGEKQGQSYGATPGHSLATPLATPMAGAWFDKKRLCAQNFSSAQPPFPHRRILLQHTTNFPWKLHTESGSRAGAEQEQPVCHDTPSPSKDTSGGKFSMITLVRSGGVFMLVDCDFTSVLKHFRHIHLVVSLWYVSKWRVCSDCPHLRHIIWCVFRDF